jgi:probable phosphoglycerate mutase
MRLILVRHGQTPANVDGILESTVPGPGLTALGHEQAEELVEALADEKIDAIFVSSMIRTHLTAAPLVAARSIEPSVRDGLREIAAGDVEGNTDEASVHQYVHTLLEWCAGELDVRMPGAETGHEVIARFDEVVDEAESLAVDSVVLGGLPIREPIAWAGPFVMNTKAEVMQAFEDFQKGRLGSIPTVPHAEVHGEMLQED